MDEIEGILTTLLRARDPRVTDEQCRWATETFVAALREKGYAIVPITIGDDLIEGMNNAVASERGAAEEPTPQGERG